MSATIAALTPHPAATWDDALALLRIRNACAAWMTGDPRQLSAADQRRWWGSAARRRSAIWLFRDAGGAAAGFGLLRMRAGRWEATLGLLPEWRGRGHGVAIYRHLIAHCPGDLYIDVLLENTRSAEAAKRAGFVVCDWTGALVTLVARRR